MRPISLVVIVIALLPIGVPSVAFAQDEEAVPLEAAQVDFFETKIRPVLLEHCYECHAATAKGIKGGLRLDTRAATRQGGDSGPAVVPNEVDESLLISALRHDGFEMPPTGKLPDAVIEDFIKWIELGAPDPRSGTPVVESAIDFMKAREHWAYQPVSKPLLPEVEHPDWCRTEIDYFTLAKMQQLGLRPVSLAARREWIRRATFDLIGLPPSPTEVSAFLNDDSPRAFETVIDRLLKSEHYGERWGRYWLDVARYAEDQAHTFSVTENTSGFRYRDWVIRAFNSDMPYDQFVKLQIAGDLLGPVAEDSYDHLIALGFFGLGAQYYKNSDAAKAAADELDDRVDTLTRGFLGLTVSCARCHDHKFDPIPTQDYYSLAGIFRSSKLQNAPLCTPEYIQSYNAGQQSIKSTQEAMTAFLAEEKSAAAESKVDEISQYIETTWNYRAAAATGQKPNLDELAAQAGLNSFLLKRWIEFLDPKHKGKVSALDPWFALIESAPPATESDDPESDNDLPEAVRQFAIEFQAASATADGCSRRRCLGESRRF